MEEFRELSLEDMRTLTDQAEQDWHTRLASMPAEERQKLLEALEKVLGKF